MGTHANIGLTWADLQAFPEDNVRRELFDGVLVVTPSPLTRHQIVVTRIAFTLYPHIDPIGGLVIGSPLDVVFDEHNVVEPDVLMFLPEHLHRIQDGYPRAAPDLVVEVSSPSTKGRDRIKKRALYERFQVPEYWIVDLDDEYIEIYRLDGERYGPPLRFGPGDTVRTPLMPNFVETYERLVPPSPDGGV